MAKFVKRGFNGGFREVPGGWSDPQCECVILSQKEYVENLERINQAKEKYDKLYEAYESWKKYAEDLEKKEIRIPEGMVALTEEEMNGYEKAVRIVRDRALQQIDKSKADEHGYRLLRADRRKYDHKGSNAWLITKSTPYSLKIGLQEAFSMIERDLREFYHMRRLPENSNHVKTLFVTDLLDFYERFFMNAVDYSYVQVENTLRALDWMAETDGVVVFEISKVAQNAASGCYEVSYWATAPI